MSGRRTARFLEWADDFWCNLTYRSGYEKNRRSRWVYALRSARCSAGVHWPIGELTGGSYSPPEPYWGCEFCGKERLPYRAWWWHGRLRAWLYAVARAAIERGRSCLGVKGDSR